MSDPCFHQRMIWSLIHLMIHSWLTFSVILSLRNLSLVYSWLMFDQPSQLLIYQLNQDINIYSVYEMLNDIITWTSFSTLFVSILLLMMNAPVQLACALSRTNLLTLTCKINITTYVPSNPFYLFFPPVVNILTIQWQL